MMLKLCLTIIEVLCQGLSKRDNRDLLPKAPKKRA